MELLLFPNQLFEPSLLQKLIKNYTITKIHFIEDPLYYGKRKGSKAVSSLSLNKLRIVYMYVTHQQYITQLQKYYEVHYHSINELITKPMDYSIFKEKEIIYIDPCDVLLEQKLQKHSNHLTRIETPSFFMTREDLKIYYDDRQGKHLQHSHFYQYVKEKLNILVKVPSMDQYNRKPYSKNMPYPKNAYRNAFTSKEIWEDGVRWIEKSRFSKNPGPLIEWSKLISEYLIYLPITITDVRKWMSNFFKERFKYYGMYQDVVLTSDPLLFHSGLSIYLNNGLITPREVIDTATKYKKDMESYEGFVRQVIGWREYCRLYYHHVPSTIYKKNVFKQSIHTLSKKWYYGGFDIPIVDHTIQHAMNYGYINHIQRLMVISNFMTLNNYHPDMIYKWMYEFSLDSYEWVMVFNCYSMGSWSDHGYAMRKPYISSANYLLKMSNEPKGEWIDIWNNSYQKFLKNKKDILKHTYLANLV